MNSKTTLKQQKMKETLTNQDLPKIHVFGRVLTTTSLVGIQWHFEHNWATSLLSKLVYYVYVITLPPSPLKSGPYGAL